MGGGGRTWARTKDPLIKSQLLYQLSYASMPCEAGAAAGFPARRVPASMGDLGMQWPAVNRSGHRLRSRRLARSIDINMPRQIITVSIADPP